MICDVGEMTERLENEQSSSVTYFDSLFMLLAVFFVIFNVRKLGVFPCSFFCYYLFHKM